jgi:2'-5' RNA ligase
LEDVVETSSTCIMLIPDETFRRQRWYVDEVHLTLAYLGRFEPDSTLLAPVRRTLHSIAKHIGGPIKATANAVGLFPDRDSFAVVDLIDGIDVFYARKHVEALLGRASGAYDSMDVKVDYTHGFTPHITREYLPQEEFHDVPASVLLPSAPIEFTFDAIGLWHGKNHYEVAL